MDNLTNIKSPSLSNLYDYFEDFQHSQSYKDSQKNSDSMYKKMAIRAIIFFVIIIVITIEMSSISSILAIIVFFASCLILGLYVYTKSQEKNRNILINASLKYRDAIAQKILDIKISDGKTMLVDSQGFLFNKNKVSWFNVSTGELLFFDKSNIKEINKQHVHAGSMAQSTSDINARSRNTFGTTVGLNPMEARKISGTITTNSQSTDNYNWYLDISLNFNECPQLLFIAPDSPDFAKLIGYAYSILSD